MKLCRSFFVPALCIAAACGAMAAAPSLTAGASQAYRQYYAGWEHYPSRGYYYRSYHYKPYVSYTGYRHHYCVYYPTTPAYVYYYNPYKKVYWGRYDMKKKGYSLLADKDRKQRLKDIPDSAFPEPGDMPPIPDSEGDVRIEPPPGDLPS